MGELVNIFKPIRSIGEEAFQRAILRNGKTILKDKTEIKWLDIELPVDPNRVTRGPSVDLIGRIGNRYVLCELKFRKDNNNTDSPEDAANQIIDYHKKIKKNWRDLENQDLHHPKCEIFKWEDLASDDTILCVTANVSYWEYWLEHRKNDISKIDGVRFYSVDIPVDTFKLQKGIKDKYTPKIETNSWDIL